MVFKTNCTLCHGVKGDGRGRASVLFNPPPADLTHSDKNDDYKRLFITMGGKAMGRIRGDADLGGQLTSVESDDVIALSAHDSGGAALELKSGFYPPQILV